MRIISFCAAIGVSSCFRTVFLLDLSRTARSFFSIRLTVRIIPAHKKDRRAKSRPVCPLAQRSTQRTDFFSAARFSDILPGSYLACEQSPGSSQFRAWDMLSPRADLTIIKEKFSVVKRIFGIFLGIFLQIRKKLGRCLLPRIISAK